MCEEKYSVYSVRKEDDFIQVLIKKESTAVCCKEYYIKDNAYGMEFIRALEQTADMCRQFYEEHIGYSWFEIAKSLMTGKYVTILLPR